MARIFLKHIAEEWYEPLYRFARSLSKNPDDAMDLTQSAFFKLTAKIDEIRDHSRVKSWLFSVVHRAYIDQYLSNERPAMDNQTAKKILSA
jgi:RNA polymerase sigma-70 factor (ECF subfamily)